MGLLAAETGEQAEEGSSSYLTWEPTACWQPWSQTWQLCVRLQLSLSHPRGSAPPLICDRNKICSSLGATAINATVAFVTVVTSSSPLEMSLSPKYYFCSVSQHCSSCINLRLPFLLTVFWTSSSCGHLSPFGVWGCVRRSMKHWMRQSLCSFKHCYTGETVVLS